MASSSTMASSPTSSSSSSTPAAASSSTRAAPSSSPAPAPAPADAAPAPNLLDAAAFPPLGTAPPRPPLRIAGPPPPPLRRSEDRRGGGKTPRYTFDRDSVKLSLASLYGSADDTASGTAATAEAGHAAPGTIVGTAEAGDASATSTTASAPATANSVGSSSASAHPPMFASPGSFAAARAVLSGAPAELPAVQAFGAYGFGTTFGDLFQDLESLQDEPPPPPLNLAPTVSGSSALVPVQGPPPLRFQLQWLQAPRDLNAPMALVQHQGPLPQFAAPMALVQHQGPLPQFAAPMLMPQFFHGYPFASSPPVVIHFQFQHHRGTLTGFAYAPWRPLQPQLGLLPAGRADMIGMPSAAGVAIQRCQDCWTRPAAVQLSPCGHVSLCHICYLRRQRCPCCDAWIEWVPIQYLF